MAGINQHYIPRFVQKGFASRGTGARAHVWLFHREREAAEPNVAGSCAERYFYGERDETAADERITEYESTVLSSLWESLCTSPAGPAHFAGIPEMLVHFESRTKNFRDVLAKPMEQFRVALQRWFDDVPAMTERVMAVARSKPIALFPAQTRKGLALRTAVRSMSDQNLRQIVVPIVSRAGGDFQQHLSAAVFSSAIKRGHNKALLTTAIAPKRALLYAPLAFSLLDIAGGGLVLGDSVTTVLPRGSVRWYSFLDKDVDVQTVLLPITASRLLIGGKPPECLRSSDLNTIAVRCSRYQFIASAKTLQNELLVRKIGAWADLLSPEEVRQTIDDCIGEVLASS